MKQKQNKTEVEADLIIEKLETETSTLKRTLDNHSVSTEFNPPFELIKFNSTLYMQLQNHYRIQSLSLSG